MTLKLAFTMWSNAPRNAALALKSRDAVQRVLMKKYNEYDLKDFTPEFTYSLFEQCTESKEIKFKAASILVYLLQWGGDNGYCKRPTFTYEIADTAPTHEVEEPEMKVKPEALEKRKKELQENNSSKKVMEKKTRGKEAKPVAQLDPEKYTLVKIWPSRSEAEAKTGACNLDRAIAHHRKSAGFFWCNPADISFFKPNDGSLKNSSGEKKKPSKVVSAPSVQVPEPQYKPYAMLPEGTVVMQERADISTFTNDELIAEMKRRGWKGNITVTINVEL